MVAVRSPTLWCAQVRRRAATRIIRPLADQVASRCLLAYADDSYAEDPPQQAMTLKGVTQALAQIS
jgi:hypothetical protein